MSTTWIRDVLVTGSAPTSRRIVCARGLLIGLGPAGLRGLQRVSQALLDFSPERLTLLRFAIPSDDFSDWRIVEPAELLEIEIPPPTEQTRETVYAQWQQHHTMVRRQLVPAALEVLELQVTNAVRTSGWELFNYLEVFLLGDLTDPTCSAPLLHLASDLRADLEVDVPVVVTAYLSIARRNDPSLSDELRAMTYASLIELNHALASDVDGSCLARPLDHCYLVDRVVESNAPIVLQHPDSAVEMIGGFLAALLLSNLRNEPRALSLLQPYHPEETALPPETGPVFGLGYTAMRLPLPALIAYCGREEARRLVSEGLLGNAEALPDAQTRQAQVANAFDLRPAELQYRILGEDVGDLMVLPDLEGVPPEQWANRLRLIQEEWQANLLPGRIRQIDQRIENVRRETLDAIHHWTDRTIHTQPHGWQTAETDLDILDQFLSEWSLQSPAPEGVPELDEVDSRLRRAVSTLRPTWAYAIHVTTILALAIWIALTTPRGWLAGPPLLLITTIYLWRGLHSDRKAVEQARETAIRQLSRLQAVQLENETRRGIQHLYRHLRESIGRDAAQAELQNETGALRRWRNVLRETIELLQPEPVEAHILGEVPYGESATISHVEDLRRYYERYTEGKAETLATEYLEAVRLGDTLSGWRELRPAGLAESVEAFCKDRYRTVFQAIDLDIESALEFLGRASLQDMEGLLEHLRLRSEPLLRRSRIHSDGSNSRLCFLLVGNPETSSLAPLAESEGLTPVDGCGLDYLAALQVERNIAISEVGGLQRLRQLYRELSDPERAATHAVEGWEQLPYLQ